MSLPQDRFNSEWRKCCMVEQAGIKDADTFIKAHYLKKRPAIVLCCLIMKCDNEPVGCVVFSAPVREASIRYGCETWELARLYLLDRIPRNAETWLIGRAVVHVRRHHAGVKMLLSYADPSVGHTGTIYRASNWRFDGMTDGERKTPRCDYVDENTGKKYGRRGNMPTDAKVVRVPRVSKHRFTYKLR